MMHLQTVTSPVVLARPVPSTNPNHSYATTINSQFDKSKSQYVDIHTRIAESIKMNYFAKDNIKLAIDTFKKLNVGVTWADFNLPKAQKATLAQILIDITLQRLPDVEHYCRIITQFDALRVMPICVYQEEDMPGSYIAFEGQHTSIALYLIALMALGIKAEECDIPIVIYNTSEKAKIRKNFIGWSTDDRKGLDPVDIYHQMIYGVRTDNTTTNDTWNLAEKKQQALEQYGIFATDSKFNNEHKPGAMSRLTELLDDKNYPLEVTEHFAKYFNYVCDSSRAVQPKESWIMYTFFKTCINVGITVDDVYIKNVAASVRAAFGNHPQNFIKIQDAAKESYQRWYRYTRSGSDGSLLGIRYPERYMVMTFFFEQIRKNIKGVSNVPTYNPPLWSVPAKDLL